MLSVRDFSTRAASCGPAFTGFGAFRDRPAVYVSAVGTQTASRGRTRIRERSFSVPFSGGSLANWWYFRWYRASGSPFRRPVSYSESGADGRIRTGDPLFTNQAAIEFSSRFSLSMYSQRFHMVSSIPSGWLQNWLQKPSPKSASRLSWRREGTACRDGRWIAVRERLETEQAQRDGGSPHHG